MVRTFHTRSATMNHGNPPAPRLRASLVVLCFCFVFYPSVGGAIGRIRGGEAHGVLRPIPHRCGGLRSESVAQPIRTTQITSASVANRECPNQSIDLRNRPVRRNDDVGIYLISCSAYVDNRVFFFYCACIHAYEMKLAQASSGRLFLPSFWA